jgi:hypothetical protein
MMTIRVRNLSEQPLASNISDYEATVFISDKVVWSGKVYEHDRTTGFSQLLRELADAVDRKPVIPEPPKRETGIVL